jgi:phage protein D
MTTPYFSILIDDAEIADYVTSFSYEDCTEEDDMLHVKIPSIDTNVLPSSLFVAGERVVFQFGYVGGAMSPLREGRISDVEWDYGKEGKSVSLKILDAGQLMKTDGSLVVWQNKTASEIAIAIARKYGLGTTHIERTTTRYDKLPQASKTDWELLHYLVAQEANGSYIFYVKDNELHFKRIPLGQASAQVFTYGVDIISFKPALRDSQNKSGDVSASVLNPLTKQITDVEVNTGNVKDQTQLGRVSNDKADKDGKPSMPRYDANGKVKKS